MEDPIRPLPPEQAFSELAEETVEGGAPTPSVRGPNVEATDTQLERAAETGNLGWERDLSDANAAAALSRPVPQGPKREVE